MSLRDPLEVHQSDAQVFEDCPAKYHAIYIEGVRDESSSAHVGTACHRAIEQITLGSAGREEWRGMSPMAIAREVIRQTAERLRMTPAAYRDALEVMEGATNETSRLRFTIWPTEHAVAEYMFYLDERFEISTELDAARGLVAYAGTIDRISWFRDGKVVVRDYKSSIRPFAQADIAQELQAQIYALAALRLFPDAPSVTFQFVLLRHGYWVEETFVRGEPWERKVKDRLRAVREGRRVAVRDNAWPEILGEGCAYCPVQGRCKTIEKASKQKATIIKRLPPDEIARRAVALKALAKAYDQAARKLAANTPIPLGNGAVLGNRLVRGRDLTGSYTETLTELRSLGLTGADELELFRPRASDVPGAVSEALYKLNPASAAQHLEQLLQETPTTRFEVFRADKAEEIHSEARK